MAANDEKAGEEAGGEKANGVAEARRLRLLDLTDDMTVEEMLQEIGNTEARLAEVDRELDALMGERQQLEGRVATLADLEPQVLGVETRASELAKELHSTHMVAVEISQQVRTLDRAQGRVNDALKRVNTILEMKNSIDDVENCLKAQDYNGAAKMIYQTLRPERRKLLEDTDTTTYGILQRLEEQLSTAISQGLQHAKRTKNFREVMRFAKMFPLINQRAEGLSLYCSTLRGQLGLTLEMKGLSLAKLPKNQVPDHIEMLGRTLEEMTHIIQREQRVLEGHFGVGAAFRLVQEIQLECDVQIVRLLHEFIKANRIQARVNEVLEASRARENAPEINLKQLDELLNNITFVCAEAEEFDNDLRDLGQQALAARARELQKPEAERSPLAEFDNTRPEELSSMSKTKRNQQELIGHYMALEQYYMNKSVEKAIDLDTRPSEGLTSTIVDDVCFVLRTCCERAFQSYDVQAAIAIVNIVRNTIEDRFLRHMQKCVGKLPGQGAEGFTDEVKDFFAEMRKGYMSREGAKGSRNKSSQRRQEVYVVLNNLDMVSNNISTLKDELEGLFDKHFEQSDIKQKTMLLQCLTGLDECATKFSRIAQQAVARHSCCLHRTIDTALDRFRNLDYRIQESHYSDNEVNDPFTEHLTRNLGRPLAHMRAHFTKRNFDRLILAVLDYFCPRLERQVVHQKFSFWGGMQFDKDVRKLLDHFSALMQLESCRGKFSRLTQIAYILQFEKALEIEMNWGTPHSFITLKAAEVKQILRLRHGANGQPEKGFSPGVIDSLKLVDAR